MQPFFREAAVNRETSLALLDGLRADQLAWRPTPATWGLADICEHLRLLTNIYLPALDAAIEQGHAAAAYSDRPFSGNIFSRLLVWSMEPPVRLRMRAPRALLPPPTADPVQARTLYAASQHAFELRLERSAGLDLAHVLVRSPTLRGMKFALGTMCALVLAHERRHLWQATAVRQHAEFPAT
jgi:hypothetical protein